jgi:hypothetical protein
MFPADLRTQERMIEVKFGEELKREQTRGFNKYSGSSTSTSIVITIIITLLAIAAFLLIYGIY